MANVVGNTECVRCVKAGGDWDRDNLILYEGGSSHCFTKDTEVLTDKGYLEIDKILNQSVNILNGNSEWERTVFKSYGYHKIFELHLSRNGIKKIIRTTSDHNWFVKGREGKVFTKDLLPNQYLLSNPAPKPVHIAPDILGTRTRSFEYLRWKVVKVVDTGISDETFCCETSTQSFTLKDYILTGNCFACGYTILSEDYKREHSIGEFGIDVTKEFEYVATRFTVGDWTALKEATSNDGKGYRGISAKTYTKYGVRHEYDTESGEVLRQYYPVSTGGKFSGVKVREHPKTFSSVGVTGKVADLFGQACFTNAPRRAVVIASGEADCLAAYDMFAKNAEVRGYEPTPVVSSTIGENCAAQLRTNYEWLSRFDKIYLIPDKDEAGQTAIPKLVDALPKGKVYIIDLPMKDSNLMLMAGKQKEFISAFFDARVYTPAGIVASSSIYQEIITRAETEKLPFAPFLGKLNDTLAGGVPFGFIVNILAGSGTGKSSFLNQNVVYWIKDLQERVAVVSLEADAGAYGENLLSNYVARKVSLIKDQDEKLQFVKSDAVAQAAKELFCREDGSPSFYLLDDRGDFDKLQEKIEQLIIEFGVRVILIDVISDVFSGMSIEQVDKWMAWEKSTVKRYNCIIIQVAHTRKSASGSKAASEGSFITEESLIGSGTQYRSAGINIALQRDKTAEDEVERNTTKVHCLKSRDTGFTGLACELFYDNDTHTLWDKEVYGQQHPHEF